jgi:hypothetical protein
MLAWSAFYPYLLPWVPTCANPVMDQELRRAANEFFTRTRAWCVWLDPVTTVDGVREYNFNLPANTNLVRIEVANVGAVPVNVVSYRDRTTNPATSPNSTDEGYTSDAKTLILDRAYAAGQEITVFASLAPARTATGIEDALFDKHYESIVEGAKARLMLIPNTPFHSPGAAAQSQSVFDADVFDAHLTDWRGTSAARKRTVSNGF